MTITTPTTPDQIADALFASYPENEPQAAVLQQELIIACADLVCPFLFSKYLFIWYKRVADTNEISQFIFKKDFFFLEFISKFFLFPNV